MKPIKFFIIIPIYNVESYLYKCLDSIVSQTYKNFEVICVNDGSTDKSLEIAKSYADSDSRFTLTSQANQGQSVARNKALDIAKQKWLESSQEEQEQTYITFVDSDDYLEDFALEHIATILNQNKVDIFITNTFFKVSPKTYTKTLQQQLVFPSNLENQTFTPSELCKLSPKSILTSTVAFIHKATHLFSHNIHFIEPHILHQDIAFCTHSALLASSIHTDSTPFYNYVQSENSTMRTKPSIIRCQKRAHAYFTTLKYLDNLKSQFQDENILNFLNNSCKWTIEYCIKFIRLVGYVNVGFTKKQLLHYKNYVPYDLKRKIIIHFPRIYNLQKFIRQKAKGKNPFDIP